MNCIVLVTWSLSLTHSWSVIVQLQDAYENMSRENADNKKLLTSAQGRDEKISGLVTELTAVSLSVRMCLCACVCAACMCVCTCMHACIPACVCVCLSLCVYVQFCAHNRSVSLCHVWCHT